MEIVSALLRQLSWTHFLSLIYLDDPLKRDFYAGMCRIERWNTRTLDKKIQSMLFERTASPAGRRNWSKWRSGRSERKTSSHRISYSAIPTFLTSSVSKTRMPRRTLKRRFSESLHLA